MKNNTVNYVALNDNQFAIVDAVDYAIVCDYTWCLSNGYAVTRTNSGHNLFMHRLILSEKDNFDIDHWNGNRLDNRRCNLRYATRSQNLANKDRTLAIIHSTKYHSGTRRNKTLWVSRIVANGINYEKTSTDKEAVEQWTIEKHRELFGEFSYFNRHLAPAVLVPTEDEKRAAIALRDRLIRKHQNQEERWRPVTNGRHTWPSAGHAAAVFGIPKGTIVSSIAKRITLEATNCLFWYADEEPPAKEVRTESRQRKKCAAKKAGVTKGCPVYNSNGDEYPGEAHACRAHGLPKGAVRNAIKSGGMSGGLFWARVGEDLPDKAGYRKKKYGNRSRPVTNDKGELFDSLAEAARAYGVAVTTLHGSLKNGNRCCGVTWSYESS